MKNNEVNIQRHYKRYSPPEAAKAMKNLKEHEIEHQTLDT